MNNTGENLIEIFKENIQSVNRLMNFDRDVQDMTIKNAEKLHNSLVSVENITNEQRNGKRTLDILRGIRENDSLRSRYKLIFNQAEVLLVSYFGSVLSDLFKYAFNKAMDSKEKKVLTEDINMNIEELISYGENIDEVLGELFVLKKDISFQDMKSVHRAFKKYFGIQVEKDNVVNDIILAQACRHAIVHNGGLANLRTIRQLSAAQPRNLKPIISENEPIEFSPEEVDSISQNMCRYAEKLLHEIDSTIKVTVIS